VWSEPVSGKPEGVDIALSFQYPEACKEAHEKIKEVQKRLGQRQETNLIGSILFSLSFLLLLTLVP
jgi:hypothetical protein